MISIFRKTKSAISSRYRYYRTNKVFTNTLWMLFSNGGALFIQGAYFVILARALGANGFGAIAAVMALVGILTPFSGWGSGNILIMNVSRNPNTFPCFWGNGLLSSIISGSLLTVLAIILGSLIIPEVTFWTILYLAAGDLIFSRLHEISNQGFQAVEKLNIKAILGILLSISKLIAAILFKNMSKNNALEEWACYYMISTLVASIISIYITSIYIGKPKFRLQLLTGNFKQGFNFSISLASSTIYNDVDKTMLAHYSSFEATGIYAVAYKLINFSFTPISAILSASYSRFFKYGAKGISSSFAFAKRLLPYSIGYGILVTILLLIFAPLVPNFLGEEYAKSITALRWLAVIPMFRGIHYFVADTLTGAGYQSTRSKIQISVAILNVLLNLCLIPAYSWRGAVWASICSDGLLIFSFLFAVVFLLKKENSIRSE